MNATPSFMLKRIPLYKAFMTGKRGFQKATEAIFSLLNDESFDIIHVYSYLPMLLMSLMGKTVKVPVVFSFWNAPDPGRRAIGFYSSSELDLQLASHIIRSGTYTRMLLGSRSSYESAILLGANPKKTSFAYHGIDHLKFLEELNQDVGIVKQYFDEIRSDSRIITLPGRITARKGIFEAVQALAIIRQEYNAELLLTSTGGYEDRKSINKVLILARSLGVERHVHISRTMIPHNHMATLYKFSDVVITPSYFEGLGFTAIEALLAERPLVMTNVPGLNEIGQHGKNCLMVPPKEAELLAKSIEQLLRDEELANKLASASRDSVSEFTMANFVVATLRTYKEVLHERKT